MILGCMSGQIGWSLEIGCTHEVSGLLETLSPEPGIALCSTPAIVKIMDATFSDSRFTSTFGLRTVGTGIG